jgi:ankyrin repeat protein
MRKHIIVVLMIASFCLYLSHRNQHLNDLGEKLVTAAYYGDLIEVKNTLEQGARLFHQLTFEDPQRQYSRQTFNALHAAASAGDTDTLEFLIEQGMDINAVTPDHWTALFIAARDGQAKAAKWLIAQGAEINTQTNLGSTALTMVLTQPYPTEKERLDLLEYMLKRGADIQVEDVYHHTPLYYAKTQNNQTVVQLLEQYNK